ncbi:MAG: FAD-binding protein [Clostridiales bacterium]|nr:FAD-binding protein [Clostridiales bacterium]
MEQDKMYDCIIIGGGPAGMTAGIYLARANKKVLLLEGGAFGGQIATTTRVENYPGAGSITGPQLSLDMLSDLQRTSAEIICENCISLDIDGDLKVVKTDSAEYLTKTVILAMGVRPRQINSDMEDRYKLKGLSYSATQEGKAYAGKKVAIVGGGKSAFVDAFYMSEIADTMLIHRTDKFRVTEAEVEEAKSKGIKIIPYHVIRDLQGDDRLEKLVLVNTQTGEETVYDIDGLFISAGRVPNTELVAGVIDLDDSGYIVSDDCRTNVDGVFACGDIRTKDLRQIVTATSDGAICAILAIGAMRK